MDDRSLGFPILCLNVCSRPGDASCVDSFQGLPTLRNVTLASCSFGRLGCVIDGNLGLPEGREAGFQHPAVIVTAQRILDARPTVIHIVPLTTTIRAFTSEVVIEPDDTSGLKHRSAAQCQHVRAVSTGRAQQIRGNVGSTSLTQIRETLGLMLDIPPG